MKNFEKADLQEKAERIMKAHNADAVWGTSDGEIFLKEHEAKSNVRDFGGAPGERLKMYVFGMGVASDYPPAEAKNTNVANGKPADDVDLHGNAAKLKADKADKAKAAEAAKVPGAGKVKEVAPPVGEDTNREGIKPQETAKQAEGEKPQEPGK